MRKLCLIVSLVGFFGIGAASEGCPPNYTMCCILVIPLTSLAPFQEVIKCVQKSCKEDVQISFVDGQVINAFNQCRVNQNREAEQTFFIFVYELMYNCSIREENPNYLYIIEEKNNDFKIVTRNKLKDFTP